jgi:hypothetical protein
MLARYGNQRVRSSASISANTRAIRPSATSGQSNRIETVAGELRTISPIANANHVRSTARTTSPASAPTEPSSMLSENSAPRLSAIAEPATQQIATSANARAAATTELTNSFAIITRTRFGVAAYVGRIVPWVNSDVRLIAATALRSITLMTEVPEISSANSALSTSSGSLERDVTMTVTITGKATARVNKTKCTRTVRSFSHSLWMASIMVAPPARGIPGRPRWP